MKKYSLDDLFSLSKEEVYKWMKENNYDTFDNELYSKWAVTKIMSDNNYMTKEDNFYISNTMFYGLYLTEDAYLTSYLQEESNNMSHINLVKAVIDLSIDSTGKEIFNTFVKKYRADNIFGRKKNEIKNFYDNKRLTFEDNEEIVNSIHVIESIVENFIRKVEEERKFAEKSGSGKGDRDIRTTEDWAEALIEFQSLSIHFLESINSLIAKSINIENLESYCDSLDYEDCSSPCVKNKGVFGKSCAYDYEKLMEKDCESKEFDDCTSPCKRKIKNRLTGNVSCVYKN